MINVMRQLDIEVPAERLWEILSDYGNVSVWSPNVSHSVSTKGGSGVGTERECAVDGFGTITETVSDWAEGKRISILIENVTLLHTALSTWSLTALDEKRTRVTVDLEAQPKYGPLGGLMGAAVMKPKMGATLQAALEGLRYHAVTGKPVGDKVPELLAA